MTTTSVVFLHFCTAHLPIFTLLGCLVGCAGIKADAVKVAELRDVKVDVGGISSKSTTTEITPAKTELPVVVKADSKKELPKAPSSTKVDVKTEANIDSNIDSVSAEVGDVKTDFGLSASYLTKWLDSVKTQRNITMNTGSNAFIMVADSSAWVLVAVVLVVWGKGRQFGQTASAWWKYVLFVIIIFVLGSCLWLVNAYFKFIG